MNTLTRQRRTSSPLRNLQGEVNRLFESLFPETMMDDDGERASAIWSPRMDLTEAEDRYHLHVDLPGVSKEDVSIQVEDERLSIRGKRHEETTTESEDMVRKERSFGTFYRAIGLPRSVNEENITATFDNGVLSIEIPKTEKSKAKEISIS